MVTVMTCTRHRPLTVMGDISVFFVNHFNDVLYSNNILCYNSLNLKKLKKTMRRSLLSGSAEAAAML